MIFKQKNTSVLIIFLLFLSLKGWSQLTLTASGNQAYCPETQLNIVTDFNIDNPSSEVINSVYIQISEGYDNTADSKDKLEYIGSNSDINALAFNQLEGKLELQYIGSGAQNIADAALIAAVKEVVFENTSATPSDERVFSITIGQANYLPSTDHYYEYIPDIGITWSAAKAAAEALPKYFGVLQGYLATITSIEEAQLSGEQAGGAGWIGGSDEAVEGTWRWMTGPEAGKSFWLGDGNGTTVGTDIPFAFWNSANNEPNNLGDEDYAHVTAPGIGKAGSWNDLSNVGGSSGDYQPKGYIVEYGGIPGEPSLNISASSKIYIPEILNPIPNERCGAGNVTLEATATFGDVLWYNSDLGGVLLHTGNNYTINISNTTTFYIQDSESVCSPEQRTPIIATINPLPIVELEVTLKNCDEDGNPDGYTYFNLTTADPIITIGDTSLVVTYYLTPEEANDGTNPLNPSPFNSKDAVDKKVYARVVENSKGCHSISILNLETIVTSFPPNFNYEIAQCDIDDENDGFSEFDLTEASDYLLPLLGTPNLTIHYYKNLSDAQLEKNEILSQSSYINQEPKTEELYVRVESSTGNCFGIGQNLTLIVHPRPEFEIEAIPTDIFCLNKQQPVTLKTINEESVVNVTWFNEDNIQISPSITEGGIYTAIATSPFGCESFSKSITISESNIAIITEDDITITDDSSNNTITINTSNLGIGKYEFTLDDPLNPYQDENIFENVSPGIHTVYIQDKNNCGIASIEVSVIGYPKFFSPNGDEFNPYWKIQGVNSDFYATSLVSIFDRYGRLITQINLASEGWDGNYNGEPMPATDYWFTATLVDKQGVSSGKKGHFSLIR